MLLLMVVLAAQPRFEVFKDKGEFFVRAGTVQHLRVGAEFRLLGEQVADTGEYRTVGKAVVLELWPTLARVSLDADAQRSLPTVPDGQTVGNLELVPMPLEPESASTAVPTPKQEPTNPFRVHRNISIGTLGGVWAITVITTIALRAWAVTAVPIIGPFFSIAITKSTPGAFFYPAGEELAWLSGFLQSGLAVYMLVSIIGEATWHAGAAQIAILPGPSPLGLTVAARF